MRSSTLTLFLFSSLVGSLACGSSSGEDETTTDPTNNPSIPSMPTTVDTDDAGTTVDTPTEGSATGTSNGPAPTSETEPETTAPTTSTSTTTVDPDTTSPETTNPETTNESTDDTGPPPCNMVMATVEPVPPNVMFVLDKSGSMVAPNTGFWDADADPNTPDISRWNSLYQVVADIANANESKINFGANLFPSKAAQSVYNAAACPVLAQPEVPVAANNAANILAAIPAAADTTLKGGTPSAAGVATALNHLKSIQDGAPKVVFLITDGAANCNSMAPNEMARFEVYDDSLHTIVSDAWTVDGIPTYVIGIDIDNMVTPNMNDGNPNGINPFDKLTMLATQGGTNQFYNALNQIELQAALDIIVSQALSCVVPLAPEPGFPEFTEVEINGALVPKVTDCATENGWVYVNPMGPYTSIELCGTACTDLKSAGEADVNYFCEPK